MYRPLNEIEQKWIKELLSVEFQGKYIIVSQIANAKVKLHCNYSDAYLKFCIPETVKKYPLHIRVPVEMRVYQKKAAPVVFLLHIINGIVSELEFFTADFSKLDIKHIEIDKIEFEIDKEAICK